MINSLSRLRNLSSPLAKRGSTEEVPGEAQGEVYEGHIADQCPYTVPRAFTNSHMPHRLPVRLCVGTNAWPASHPVEPLHAL